MRARWQQARTVPDMTTLTKHPDIDVLAHSGDDAETSTSLNRAERRGAGRSVRRAVREQAGGFVEHPLTVRIRVALGLDPTKNYKVAIIRVSSAGNVEKLDDQKDTGITAYVATNPDFANLASSPIDVVARGWLEFWLTDLNPAAPKHKLGWVGLIGSTIFVAVAGSAHESNLPPDPNDPAALGRNAFIDLLIHAALAGHASDILAPFMSRWWRNDLWAEVLMASINLRLPNCTLWNGDEKVATAGPDKIVTNVRGQAEGSTYRHTLATQVFTKDVEALGKGEWHRRESELPLGLRRKRITVGEAAKLSKTVEEAPDHDIIRAGLRLRAQGNSWEQVGDLWAQHRVRMPGVKGVGRTFDDYRSGAERARAARQQFYRWEDYYRSNSPVVRRSIDHDPGRGQKLDYDAATGRRFKDIPVRGWPWRPYLTEAEWAAFDQHEAAQDAAAAEKRNRKTGAATHVARGDGSAFQGVPARKLAEGAEETLRPETATAYRWRIAGEIQATLRKSFMHRGCGADLLAKLRTIEDPLAAARRTVVGDDPLVVAERAITQLDAAIAEEEKHSAAADREVQQADADGDADEVAHWRDKGREARRNLRVLREQREAAVAELQAVQADLVETEDTLETDVTEAVLLATLLNDGGTAVDPLVVELCDRYGISDSIRPCWAVSPDPDGRGGKVRLKATAAIPLANGATHPLELEWTVDNTKEAPGDQALTETLMRAWAAGQTFEEIAQPYPHLDAERVRRRISGQLEKLGIGRDLRRTLLRQPLVHPKAIIAARALGDASLANGYTASVRADVEAAYIGSTAVHPDLFCDTGSLDEHRRVLAVFATGDAAAVIDIATVARKASVDRTRVYKMLAAGLLTKVGTHGVTPKCCTWQITPKARPCGAALTIFTPAPETASGLICPRCGRPEGKSGVFPGDYQLPWVLEEGVYTVSGPAVVGRGAATDHCLTVGEVAKQLSLSTHGVRELDRENILVPDSRGGRNGGRLYRKTRIDRIEPAKVLGWQARFGPRQDDELLGPADAAALLDCDPALIRDFSNAGVLPVATETPGGHRRYRREDVDALDRAGIDAYRLTPIGEAAEEFGLPTATLRDLTDTPAEPDAKPKVRCHVTLLGQRRFDLDELRTDLQALDLDGSRDNPIVGIGELAAHRQVRLSTGQIRTLTDRSVIPAAGRVGGKRRYRLADALTAIFEARAAGQAPALGGQLPPGRR